jgi:hypothetical protein
MIRAASKRRSHEEKTLHIAVFGPARSATYRRMTRRFPHPRSSISAKHLKKGLGVAARLSYIALADGVGPDNPSIEYQQDNYGKECKKGGQESRA